MRPTRIAISCTRPGPIATPDARQDGPRELFVKKGGVFTRYALERPPMDVVGWDGFVYPWAFAIEKYQPKTGLVHLPPTIHSTFAAPGFLVCSFVPRVTDYSSAGDPVPVSALERRLRRGHPLRARQLHEPARRRARAPSRCIRRASRTVRIRARTKASIGTTRTDELAVMIDTYLPLVPTAQARNIEDDGYHESWSH